jgi:hypothetical protein
VSLAGLQDLRSTGRLWRQVHHKRWMYLLLAGEKHLLATAVVHLGWAATSFVVLLDRTTRARRFDRSTFTPAPFCGVGDRCEGGCAVHFRGPGLRTTIDRAAGSARYQVGLHAGGLELEAQLEVAGAPDPLVAVSRMGERVVNVTEKRVLLGVEGQLRLDGVRMDLAGAQAGFDYAHGYLARHTQWRWAFGMGRTTDGRALGLNFVEGFNEEREGAVWLDGALYPMKPVRFGFDRRHPDQPWRIRSEDGAVSLEFRADAVHAEKMELGLARSRFVQPLGAFAGTITVPGVGTVRVEELAGVVEDQDVVW